MPFSSERIFILLKSQEKAKQEGLPGHWARRKLHVLLGLPCIHRLFTSAVFYQSSYRKRAVYFAPSVLLQIC